MFKVHFFLITAFLSLFICGCQAPPTPQVESVPSSSTPTIFLKRTPDVDLTAISAYKETQIAGRMATKLAPTPSPIFPIIADWCPMASPQPHDELARIIYVGDTWSEEDGIWVWDHGEQPTRIVDYVDVGHVLISNDGERIIYSRGDSEKDIELWAIKSDGTGNKLVLSSNDLREMTSTTVGVGVPCIDYAEWASNSPTVLISLCVRDNSANSNDYGSVWKIDIESSKMTYLGTGNFNVSPNGEFVLIFDDTGIDIFNVSGDVIRQDVLPEFRRITEDDRCYFLWPHWSSDSSHFLIAQPENDNIYEEEATFSVRRVWVEEDHTDILGMFVGFAASVRFSPDHQFMFYEHNWHLRPSELHLVNLDSLEDIIYAEGDVIQFGTWSPNSYDFVFMDGYEILFSNICQHAEYARKHPRPNFSVYIYWICDSTLLSSEREGIWYFHFESSLYPDYRSDIHGGEMFEFVCIQTR